MQIEMSDNVLVNEEEKSFDQFEEVVLDASIFTNCCRLTQFD